MAWTSPKTWTTGELVSAALANEQWRDNMLETAPAKVTTAGDIVYATGANALTRLGIGTARQALLTNAGATAPEWQPSPQSVLTGAGDLLYASAANTLARLGIGTANQVLRTNAGATAPEWETPTSAATANALVRRDASGRSQFADPSAAADAATKNYCDSTFLKLSGGIMTGILYPQQNTAYTTGQARRIILSTADPSGGGNGDVWIKYIA